MKIHNGLLKMEKLGWDQSFLDDDQPPFPPNPTILPSKSLVDQNNNNIFNTTPPPSSQNQNLSEKSIEEAIKRKENLERLYQNFQFIHDYINTSLVQVTSNLHHQPLPKNNSTLNNKKQKNTDSIESKESGEKREDQKFKYLLEELERKKTSQPSSNSYLNSSLIISSYTQKRPELNDNHSIKDTESPDSEELRTVYQHNLPFLEVLRETHFLDHLSQRYGLVDLLRSDLLDNQSNQYYQNESFYRDQRTSFVDKKLRLERRFSKKEWKVLKVNLCLLLQCGFYFGRITSDEACSLLKNQHVGTFFLRDSSNPDYLFSLSLQTSRGSTSIRIFFQEGCFGLETDPILLSNSQFSDHIPKFESIIKLIQHYVQNPNKNTLEESSGRCDTPLLLTHPLSIKPPKLSHLARREVHKRLMGQEFNQLFLDPSLLYFLKQYPYFI